MNHLRQAWPMPAAPRAIVIIGAGSIVRTAHLPAYTRLNYPIAGLFDICRDAADQTAGLFGGLPVFQSLDEAAPELGVTLVPIDIKSAGDLETAFADMKKSEAEALIVLGGAVVIAFGKQIADLAIRARLPSCYYIKDGVIAGGLISYGARSVDLYRQGGTLTGQVLMGKKPADLPVLQPTKFELVINMKTAKALGLTISSGLLSIADELID